MKILNLQLTVRFIVLRKDVSIQLLSTLSLGRTMSCNVSGSWSKPPVNLIFPETYNRTLKELSFIFEVNVVQEIRQKNFDKVPEVELETVAPCRAMMAFPRLTRFCFMKPLTSLLIVLGHIIRNHPSKKVEVIHKHPSSLIV